MSFQYVMANIQIPIKIHENNVTEPLPEYIKINISECGELPERQQGPAIQSDFMEQIRNMVSPKCEDAEKTDPLLDIVNMMTISKEDVKHKKPKKHAKNITFKNNILSRRQTHRNYSNS